MKTSEKNSLLYSTVRREDKPPTFHKQYYKNTLDKVNCVTVNLTKNGRFAPDRLLNSVS